MLTDRSKEANLWSAAQDTSLSNNYIPEFPVPKANILTVGEFTVEGELAKIYRETFFVGAPASIHGDLPIMSITMDPDDLFSSTRGIYVLGDVWESSQLALAEPQVNPYTAVCNYSCEGRGWERKAQLEYFVDGERVLMQDVGIRIHGGWSVAHTQKSFNIYAREEYGAPTFGYEFLGLTLNKLILRTGGFRDTYVTKMRDVLNQSLIDGCDITTQGGEPCVVYLNGEYWGLYWIQGSVDAGYIAAQNNLSPDLVSVIKNGTLADGSDEDLADYQEFMSWAMDADMSQEDNYEAFCQSADALSYADFCAFETYVANCDSLANNFALWRYSIINPLSPFADGRWRWMVFDTDDSAGMVEGLTEPSVDSFIEGHWVNGLLDDPLFLSLSRNDDFLALFVDSFLRMADEHFPYERVAARISELEASVGIEVVRTQQRFRGSDYAVMQYRGPLGHPYSQEDLTADIAVIDNFFRQRRAFALNYLQADLDFDNSSSTGERAGDHH